VDAPDFSLWLEKRLKDRGIPAIHFVSPSIWAWRKGRLKGIARAVSHMLCLFPFEPELYRAAGVPVSYVGHPLADVFPLCPTGLRGRCCRSPGGPVFAFLPGSRQSEVRNLADTYIATAALHERHPGARFLVPLATRETRLLFEEALRRHAHLDLPIRILFGHAVEAMIAADVVLVASGTATLEAALLKRPMVITYKIGKWSYRLMRRWPTCRGSGLPNVLAGREVVPEVLQDAATPQALADALDGWLADRPGGRAHPVSPTCTSSCARTPPPRPPRRSCPTCRGAPDELLCGVDEAGRGPLCGPVVAAAVILDPARPIAGLADSKSSARSAATRWPSRSARRPWPGASPRPAWPRSTASTSSTPPCSPCSARWPASAWCPAACRWTATAAPGSTCPARRW
jgi:hypothetical protein